MGANRYFRDLLLPFCIRRLTGHDKTTVRRSTFAKAQEVLEVSQDTPSHVFPIAPVLEGPSLPLQSKARVIIEGGDGHDFHYGQQ